MATGRRVLRLGATAGLAALAGTLVVGVRTWQRLHAFHPVATAPAAAQAPALPPFERALVGDLQRQVGAAIRYQDGYYVGGEPPPRIGVCTDVVIRAFGAAGVDLARRVARDIRQAPAAYGIRRPDPNIDHRRCRNLIVYFRRHAERLPAAGPDARWRPGDVVFWSTHGDGVADHVGVVAAGRLPDGTPTIVHHWPGLPVSETDGLLTFPVAGHFRWPHAIGRQARERQHVDR